MSKCGNALVELGILPNLIGFNYICQAVNIIHLHKEQIPITRIYEEVADIFDVSTTSVERGIRHAFSKCRETELYGQLLGYAETNGERLYTLAYRLEEYKDE
jgi:hypothetical protein